MARKCSSCGNNGHNSRTCSGHGRVVFENGGGGGGGVRLFGVQLHVGSSSSPMKRCFSMECLSSAAPPPAYYAALAASSSSPSVSSSSSLVSVEETPDKMASNGYLSDGLMGRGQERKKGVPWTEDEHRKFLAGLEKLGKGDWRGISRHFVTTRTPTQVASHAQKYFLRQSSLTHKKRRSSLFDVVENADRAMNGSEQHRLRLKDVSATASSTMPGTELPALSLSISSSSREAKPERALPPSLSSLPHQPRCSAAMSGGGGASPKHKHHPSSSSLQMLSKQQAHQASIQAPDLELKISAADHQAATGSSPRTPFFGTIRVT